jgi:hypothetical protein
MMRKFTRKTASKLTDAIPSRAGRQADMISKNRIGHEVEETLLCFGRDQAPAARRDFDARLRSRIRDAESRRPLPFAPLLRREVLVPAVLAALIALNVVSAVVAPRRAASDAAVRQQAISALALEFNLQAEGLSSYWK